MESCYEPYDYLASFARMRGMLDGPNGEYAVLNELPDRSEVTDDSGFYANCSALFVDIRRSGKLAKKHPRSPLARVHRTYLSEVVAILTSEPHCRDVTVVGNGVAAVYNTRYKADIDVVFDLAAKLYSMVDVLAYELDVRGIEPIMAGIGLCYGKALVIRTGHAANDTDNVVYMGDVINTAAKLAAVARGRWVDKAIMVDTPFRNNLNEHKKKLLAWNEKRGCWHGDVYNTAMENYYEDNCL